MKLVAPLSRVPYSQNVEPDLGSPTSWKRQLAPAVALLIDHFILELAVVTNPGVGSFAVNGDGGWGKRLKKLCPLSSIPKAPDQGCEYAQLTCKLVQPAPRTGLK
jgi:hypothetical protein